MYYLLVRSVWKEDVTMIDVSEHQQSPGGTFLTHTPSRIFMCLSPVVQPEVGDRFLQINQPISLNGQMVVFYYHERQKRVFFVTTQVLEDSVQDGLADVTSLGFPGY